MEIKRENTFRADIFLAGDIDVIRQTCREYCYRVGLCVSVSACDFIYTGGEEAGARVGLVNYPRFPTTPDELVEKARTLAVDLMRRACQHSALVVTDDETIWISVRDENKAAK